MMQMSYISMFVYVISLEKWSAVAKLVECLTGESRVASLRLTAGRVAVLCP